VHKQHGANVIFAPACFAAAAQADKKLDVSSKLLGAVTTPVGGGGPRTLTCGNAQPSPSARAGS